MEYSKLDEDIYAISLFGNDFSEIKLEDSNYKLAVFNFFGTLVWGDCGKIWSYKNIIPSSPYLKESFLKLKQKKYTICVIEYVPVKNLKKYLEIIKIFFDSLQGYVSINFLAFTNKDISRIKYGLLEYFKPKDNKFNAISFYTGDEVNIHHSYPWYRASNRDAFIANDLGFVFYDPVEVIGSYDSDKYEPNTLYITCGCNYSGLEIELESFREIKIKNGVKFRFKQENDLCLYAIHKDDLLKNLVSEISINFDETYIIFGNNPTCLDRDILSLKFKNYSQKLVRWYAKYPYKKTKDNDAYHNCFENPLLTGEIYVRVN